MAVVLALLASFVLAGPPAGTSGGPPAGATAAGSRWDDGPRADDGCDGARTGRAATRQDPHHEHPAPRGHLAAGPHDPLAAPPRPARHPAPAGHLPGAGAPAGHDRDRAPPATSGT
ncbi:hypothetical protein ACH4F6_01470 [Streptomyces sp. NPDC017936]|uniref:hypothetical protein n=1 Tax=Streptomyces sp. NPDC017936 TaxID=3365016 RepID=UPI0037A555BF